MIQKSSLRENRRIVSDVPTADILASLRLVEERLLERGILVSYDTIRRWALKFGADYVRA